MRFTQQPTEYADAATKKKKDCSKILSHIINVQSQSLMMLAGKSIGVHQFDNCLSQVKINVTTAVSCHT